MVLAARVGPTTPMLFWNAADSGIMPRMSAPSAESCIRKAVIERRLTPGFVGLADTKAEDEAAARWADFASAYGD
jgi:hypothetical protein